MCIATHPEPGRVLSVGLSEGPGTHCSPRSRELDEQRGRGLPGRALQSGLVEWVTCHGVRMGTWLTWNFPTVCVFVFTRGCGAHPLSCFRGQVQCPVQWLLSACWRGMNGLCPSAGHLLRIPLLWSQDSACLRNLPGGSQRPRVLSVQSLPPSHTRALPCSQCPSWSGVGRD